MHQLSNFLFRSSLGAALLFSAVATASAALSVGASRVDITPPADPANPPSGKYEHERLYVRAIVVENGSARAVLIGADQSGLSEQVWTLASKQIASELNCPVANILMSATHTHSGLAAGDVPGRGGFGPPDPNAPPPPVVAKIVEAVRQAKARLQPAKWASEPAFPT
jgi:neutral ceramidase